MAPSKKKTSTLIKGTAFEKQVLDVLRLLPGFSVQEHVNLGGKDIDALCEVDDPIGISSNVAFECKDYERPLTREYTASILADYQPLLNRNLIDRFCLVTRNGIVANAKKCLDGKTTQHLTYDELLDRLISPRPLISNMIKQFMIDDLNKYYIPTSCYYLDIPWVSRNFHLIYNPFIDFALESGINYLDVAEANWLRLSPDATSTALIAKYTPLNFEKVISLRKNVRITDLEPLILKWINDQSVSQSIAILGSYGTGKSSFAKRLAYFWAERYQEGKTDRIPFLIELRDFGSHQDIRGLITHELVNRHGIKYGSYECFNLLNQQGKFLLILDGFDEMKQGLSKDILLFNFNELNKLYTRNSKILLCGRPTVFSSEVEQTSILSGSNDANFTHPAEYIQLAVAPFSQGDVFSFLETYASIKHPTDRTRILEIIEDLKEELPRNPDLDALLSRPVHLPMLVTVLPGWRSSIRDLSRAKLYELFIQKTIAREMLKRKQEFQEHYDAKARKRFASDLAVQMFRLGDSRSIRYSEIPDDLVRPFKHQGQTIEGAKRDLVTACFLERKPPDILFFGHKSFAEYLVAEKIVSLMEDDVPSTSALGIRLTPEMISFVLEMASTKDWTTVASHPEQNMRLMDEALKFLLRKQSLELPGETKHLEEALHRDEVVRGWQSTVDNLPAMTVFRLIEFIETCVAKNNSYSKKGEDFLRYIVTRDEDMSSVHAYRALKMLNVMTVEELPHFLGKIRFDKWKKLGWI